MLSVSPLPIHSLSFIIFFAYLLDLMLGDPRWLPHPVRWIGASITFFESKIRLFAKAPAVEKLGGVFLFILAVGTTYAFTQFILYFTYRLSPIAHSLLSIFLAYTTLSIKSLHQEAWSVTHAMKNISIDEARNRLANIVGRDTRNLSEEEIYRAVVETVAENTSDGIVAPLFYLAIGGPALALAYKAVNTLDSMVGYKNERYKNFGWFSARMDDVANFIPARITAVLMVIACFILR
ncbi:MAG: cobalamin biosynthesis protein CobD, partial [Deltaproteobacteria bacterium]|nr:cobalamin biosynthesis protein CobD [Deltaproteobacteria bacterium]